MIIGCIFFLISDFNLFNFRNKNLVLEHRHFKLPRPHALFDPMDLMIMIPQEVVDQQVEGVGEDLVQLVD